ncbi:MAG: EamA family transporter [Phycisphaerae bacterium]
MFDAKTESPRTGMIVLAFALVYVVWGSTYLAIKFAIETLPPFLMAAMRFLAAGAVLYALVRRGGAAPTLKQWGNAAIVGGLLLLGGNGLVCWAEQSVPSGLAALLIATVPLWMVGLDSALFRAPRPSGRVVLGIVVGLVGVAVLLNVFSVGGEKVHVGGAIALLSACVLWSLGSLISRKVDLPKSPFQAVAMEMIAGGLLLGVTGTLLGEWPRVNLDAVSLKSVLALLYLIVFGAIVALSAYVWLLRVCEPAKVATYAYVNPVIAVLLGYFFANEKIGNTTLAGAALIVFSVALVTMSARKKAASTPPSVTESKDERVLAVPTTAPPTLAAANVVEECVSS